MASGKHNINVEAPIEHVWTFVSDMDKWAPLVPGYAGHKIINERQSTWKLKGEVGKMQKTICLDIDILEWQEPSTITFKLSGWKNTISGDGYFHAKALDRENTRLTGYLGMTAKGLAAPMMNSMLKSFIEKKGRILTERVAREMMSRRPVRT